MSERSEQTVTLAFLAQQQAKIIGELSDQRADMAILLAIVRALHGRKSGGLVTASGIRSKARMMTSSR